MGISALENEMHEKHTKPTLLSDFILGAQDGLVNVLGIILGVSAATSDTRILFIAAFAALAAEAISMGAVAYTSTLARRRHYMKEADRERYEMRAMPHIEREEVRQIFEKWGYTGKKLKRLTDEIVSNPRAWLEMMMSFELGLAPIDKSAPMQSAVVVLLSTTAGSLVPLLPFVFIKPGGYGDLASVIVSGIALFIIGWYEAKSTVGSVWKTGLEMVAIGLTAGFAGFLIGHIL